MKPLILTALCLMSFSNQPDDYRVKIFTDSNRHLVTGSEIQSISSAWSVYSNETGELSATEGSTLADYDVITSTTDDYYVVYFQERHPKEINVGGSVTFFVSKKNYKVARSEVMGIQ